ncbi:MAG TPA: hypothetical protein ENK15_00030 [Thermopetrobacter sp.]|nr:hypothetical protein [Thermopetrobacter sp.]
MTATAGLTPPEPGTTTPSAASGGPLAPLQVQRRIRETADGKTRLSLAARLTRHGGLIRRPIRWRVVAADRMVVFDGARPALDLALPPGRYDIFARYGLRRITYSVKVRAAERHELVFVLDVGALRALAGLWRLPLPPDVAVEYRLHAAGRASPLLNHRQAGRVVRLMAGRYELRVRYRPGNVETRAGVTVKAGVLSTLQIRAKAGLARIRAARWRIRAAADGWRASGQGGAALVLAPGRYELHIEGMVRPFVVQAGRRVELP